MIYPNHVPVAVPGGSSLLRRIFTTLTVALSLAACSDLPMAPNAPSVAPPERENERSSYASLIRGAELYVHPYTRARQTISEWRQARPTDAALLEKIANQPMAIWFGDWTRDPFSEVRRYTGMINAAGALPVYVLYNIPLRDCGQWSAGGAAGADSYARWISEVARGLGNSRAVVILEPDAIGLMDCLSAAEQEARYQMIRNAVQTLNRSGNVAVYLDGGHAGWHSPEGISKRLRRAGIEHTAGFFLNVAHFRTTAESIRFGTAISALVGGKHFVIDTSRNGVGATPDSQWCNPAGRALGTRPTTATDHPLVDAYLWIKTPGESDGECNGGPTAGQWWPEYAIGLAKRANW